MSRMSSAAEVVRMKRLALALLLVMLTTFAVSATWQEAYPWLRWVRAFAEAGSVGAIADWFAVTALFRHPLGLPIPHTAIIPRNKDEIGTALGKFVEENFLTPENVARRLREADAVGQALNWLYRPENSQRCARATCELLPGLLERLGDEDLRRFLDRAVVPQLERLDVAALAGEVLEILTHEGRHQALLDQGLGALDDWLQEHRDLIRQKFGEASAYTPGIFDRYVVNRFVDGITSLIHDIAVDPEHEVRQRFDAATQEFVRQLKESPEYAQTGREWMAGLLAHLRSEAYYRSVWDDVVTRVGRDIAQPDSVLVTTLADLLTSTTRTVLEDPALLARLDAWILEGVEGLVVRHRQEISRLIAEVVASWDAKEVAAKVETEIGRDLQYIRINGTLVGGTVGVLLHALGRLAP